jgi:hypothetical protein
VSKQPSDQGLVRSSRITMNVTPELEAQLRRWASEEGRSVSNLCQQLIEASLVQRQRRP